MGLSKVFENFYTLVTNWKYSKVTPKKNITGVNTKKIDTVHSNCVLFFLKADGDNWKLLDLFKVPVRFDEAFSD